ncbi:MAG: acyltransferase [Candidatus Heimdallarchaeota archaeon]
MDNIFFDTNKLKKCGNNVIIGKTARIRYPELVEIGDNVIIDDFTYISTALKVDDYVHISSGCKLIGGRESLITLGKFSTLSPNVVLAAGSDDYHSGIATPLVPNKYKANCVHGSIILGKHCIVGSNAVVLPNVCLGDGAVLGALSLLKEDAQAWTINYGTPARQNGLRDKEEILKLQNDFELL